MPRKNKDNSHRRKQDIPDPDFLSPKEAAPILRVSVGTLEFWRRTGAQNVPYAKVGRNIYYERRDLYAFIRSQKIGGEAN